MFSSMYTWTINCGNGHIDTRDMHRRREDLQCIERNVNHYNVDASHEHVLWSLIIV